MSAEGNMEDGPRVGRWIPPYGEEWPAPQPGGAPTPDLRPVPVTGTGVVYLPRYRDDPHPAHRRLGLLSGVTTVAVLALVGFSVLARDDPRPPAAAVNPVRPPSFPALPAPVEFGSVPPSTPAVPTPGPASTGKERRDPTPEVSWTRITAPERPATRPAAPALVDLTVGSTIGLEVSGRPGHRVRHRDFMGRVDPLGPQSSAADRADTRFTVRAGLANRSCVSLEAVNHPGRFLRHRNFVVRLDRADGTPLFAADATFCPVPRANDAGVSLRSVNYPDRYVAENDSWLRLPQAPPGGATAFVVRPPL